MSSRAFLQRSRSAGRPWSMRDPDGTVQRDPLLHAAVGEDLRPPRVSQIPSSGWSQCSHSQSIIRDDVVPAPVADAQPGAVGEEDRVHRLAVDVELELIRGAVPDPHRARAPIALEVVEGLLVEVAAAVDAVHQLEREAAGRGSLLQRVPEPDGEAHGLLGVPEPEERVDGERRVADPGVPVVPVALASDLLREPGGGRGDQGAGRRVGHELERHRGPAHRLPPPTPVRRLVQPCSSRTRPCRRTP